MEPLPHSFGALYAKTGGRGGRFGDEGLWVRFLPFFDEFLDALTEEHKLDIMVRQQECYSENLTEIQSVTA